jgi:magnesium-transporting ATPase (P-type)
VKGASKFGFKFTGRTQTDVFLLTPENWKKIYEIKEMIAFSSQRKRMTVIVEEKVSNLSASSNGTSFTKSSKLKLFIKGADNVILSRLAPGGNQAPFYQETLGHIKQFAEQGLRTLCLASRDLTLEEYAIWQAKYMRAKVDLNDREAMMEEAADLVSLILKVLKNLILKMLF